MKKQHSSCELQGPARSLRSQDESKRQMGVQVRKNSGHRSSKDPVKREFGGGKHMMMNLGMQLRRRA